MVFGLGLSRLSGPSRGLGHWMHIYIYMYIHTFIYAVHMMSLWYDGSGNLYASKAASIKLIARNYFGSRYCRLLVTLSSTQMPPMKRLHKKTKAAAKKKGSTKKEAGGTPAATKVAGNGNMKRRPSTASLAEASCPKKCEWSNLREGALQDHS